jgi:hypothetical protein
MALLTPLVAVLVVEFFASTPDEKKPHEIKTEPDKAGGGRKSWYLLDMWHHLGNSV